MTRTAYLVHLVSWATPVLALQLVVLAARDGRRAPGVVARLLPAVAGVSAWLVAADAVAVRAGLWRFAPELHLGVSVAGVPVEEVLFFVASNLLVALGVALVGGARR